MKLAKPEETAVLRAYHAYWEYYISGDVAGLASLLDDEYTQIGSVEGEVFINKKEAVDFVQTTIDQISGKVDMRNRVITLEPLGHSMLITEHNDYYVLIDGEWTFYAKFRASSLLRKKGDDWKFIHQHTSMPDIRAEEGESIASEKIAKENFELRDAIKRRTIELEHKNRELALESSLERVRAVAMGMRKPDDLPGICEMLYNELQQMGFSELRNAMINIHDDEKGTFVNYDYSDEIGKSVNHLTYNIHPVIEKQVKEMRSTQDAFSETVFRGKDLDDWKSFRKDIGEKDDPRIDNASSLHYYFYSIGTGSIGISTFKEINEEKKALLKRFRNVFDFAYRRYLDVAQAESQAREAKIEAALERVRSMTMAMHDSKDVGNTVATMFDEFVKLGILTNRCGILIFSDPGYTEVWTAKVNPEGGVSLIIGHLDTMMHPMLQNVYSAWSKKELFFSYELAGDDLKNYYSAINNSKDYPTRFDITTLPVREFHSDFYFAEGAVFTFTPEPVPEDSSIILKRFAGVFGQTYRRYLDLQKAEAQAREAQIEAALERVRSRTMGMQKSEELKEVIQVVYEQFVHLNIHIEHTGFIMDYNARDDMHIWLADQHGAPSQATIPYFDCAHWNSFNEAKEKGKDFFANHLDFEEKNRFYQDLFKLIPGVPEDALDFYLSCPGLAISTVLLENVGLYIENFSGIPYTEDENRILMRFGKVFQQTYTRFLDLQKAENQVREAQVEAAMERTRTQSMIMQRSEELDETLRVFHQQVLLLGIQSAFSFLWLPDEDKDRHIFWAAWAEQDTGIFKSKAVNYPLDRNEPATAQCLVDWKSNEPVYSYHVPPAAVENYFAAWSELIAGVEQLKPEYFSEGLYYVEAFMKYGCFGVMVKSELNEDEKKILARFTIEFERTYTRFLDLQKAEAQSLEAVKRASVDRVRAEIASMRTTSDLERIQPLIWNELIILGVPFIRCGVFIMDEEKQEVQSFLSTPDGKAIAAFHQPYDTPGEISRIVKHWHDKNIYRQHWDEAMFVEFARDLEQQGAFTSGEKYMTENPPKDLYLHFLPFLQGMLYVGNAASLIDDALQLVQNLADAFSTAYARYEDFNKLEAAKQQVDKTLADLKQTQAQLVQAEKMASLGELTAGIAHEIQNPLNFVNNFSEINTELSEEIVEAAKKGDLEEIIHLAGDIKSNQDKISEHGKRADAIVKGMLQHSRSSSGVKEPTDINKLADEYFRLAYHGLKAKDKNFNALMKTDFDPLLEKVYIIPQDIGRVLLNLYNNAFFAVAEKQKQSIEGYEPIVKVGTKKIDNEIEINVADNGNGISEKLLDKVFQPFFTTKPTGQGTGLGLSLSYDIIKAHLGKINIRNTPGAGVEFIITLPGNS